MRKYLLIIFTLLCGTMQAFAEEKIVENTQEVAEPKITLEEKLEKATPQSLKIYKFNPIKNSKGHITIVEFNDLDCKKCLETGKKLRDGIPAEYQSHIKYIYKNSNSKTDTASLIDNISIYSMIAKEHDKFWEFLNQLEQKEYKNKEEFINLLFDLGITDKQINKALLKNSTEYYLNLDADHKYAKSIKNNTSPMFFIDGYQLDKDISLQELNEYIKLKVNKFLKKQEEQKYKIRNF